jgi:site-specific DNA-methyltransferase (cytosine-N4-specific)
MMLHGKSDSVLAEPYMEKFKGKVDLIFTSPPFPLNTKKKYGNLNGQEYIDWLCDFGPLFRDLLTDTGSIVIEVGNSWTPGSPTMSTLAMRSLLEFLDRNELHLCQEFIWNNPAKLPTPAQWVTIDRIRVKDSFTRIWWMSTTPKPKADNRQVLNEYSASMKKLLQKKQYNHGRRASEHHIGEKSFLTDHGGAISGSVLTYGNTASRDPYLEYCKLSGLTPHPARMPKELADFFIRFLTSPQDLVLDPFGGSNTTGRVAETLERHWISIEAEYEYILGSMARFEGLT